MKITSHRCCRSPRFAPRYITTSRVHKVLAYPIRGLCRLLMPFSLFLCGCASSAPSGYHEPAARPLLSTALWRYSVLVKPRLIAGIRPGRCSYDPFSGLPFPPTPAAIYSWRYWSFPLCCIHRPGNGTCRPSSPPPRRSCCIPR